MKLDQLTYFLETAKQEHIGKASKILAISPSAISHSISSLEEELGLKLFSKKGKFITLTPHGKLLMERAQELLNQVNAIKDELSSDELDLQGNVKLAATHVLCSQLLAPTWSKFQQQNPHLTSEMFTVRSAQVVQGVLDGPYDFGLCFSPVEHPQLESEILYQGQLKIVVKKSHPILQLPSEWQIKKLSSYKAVLPKAFNSIEVCIENPMLKTFHIHVDLECSFDSYEIGEIKVAESESWGLFPDYILKKGQGLLSSIDHPVNWDAPYTITAIWRRDRFLPKSLKRFKKELIHELKKSQLH